ncbi:glycosyltransferase family 4 protein [Methylobacterium sp. NEAU 140]|uniref:glycosyltransferase family 4 protein n=1 Tax=Methylobacterium sp. NEAU 140 TaxID=3064945 RepID=UPI002734A86C|nr:glycosyltransferase family 4 protein [Methylobacterium sp. NEAU 140]MDP4025281.1 glycosyltransferase family 4 protein [Methylobacterium sp. NEAU 140]
MIATSTARPPGDGPSSPAGGRDRLRILVLHNRYQVRGGEDAVVEREVAGLAGAGHAVEALILDNAAIRTPLDKLRVAYEAPHAPAGIAAAVAAARAFAPDVVHVHNTFPLLSPGVHAPLRALGAATVQSLHNFRVTCANGLLMRDGHPCELCLGGSVLHAVRHRCYRGSTVGSLAVARMIARHRRLGTWRCDVDRFIALTGFARDRFIAAGLPADRIRVKPNGLADPGPPPAGARSGILFAGRLSAEKGVMVLAAAAALARAPITVIGDGPLAAELRGRPNLTLLGSRDSEGVRRAMAVAAAVVVPSICYEGLPMVIPEAFAVGTPVVASRIGALGDLVGDGVTGLLAEPGDPVSLAAALDRIHADPGARRMGEAARAAYLRDWVDAAVTERALAIYREAIAARRAEGAAPAAVGARAG